MLPGLYLKNDDLIYSTVWIQYMIYTVKIFIEFSSIYYNRKLIEVNFSF